MGNLSPVIVGLVVGIAFITTSVLVFGSGILFSQGQSDSITIGIDGVSGKQYHVGDELDISVRIQGVTFDCAAPSAAIVNTDTSQTIWDSGISLVLCDPDRDAEGHTVDIVWQLGRSYTENGVNHTSQSTTRIVPAEAGEYALVVSFSGHESTFPFTVYPEDNINNNNLLLPPPSPPVAEYIRHLKMLLPS